MVWEGSGARHKEAGIHRPCDAGRITVTRPPRLTVLIQLPFLCRQLESGRYGPRCISYSSSRESGSLAVSSSSSGDFIHSWYFCGQRELRPTVVGAGGWWR